MLLTTRLTALIHLAYGLFQSALQFLSNGGCLISVFRQALLEIHKETLIHTPQEEPVLVLARVCQQALVWPHRTQKIIVILQVNLELPILVALLGEVALVMFSGGIVMMAQYLAVD